MSWYRILHWTVGPAFLLNVVIAGHTLSGSWGYLVGPLVVIAGVTALIKSDPSFDRRSETRPELSELEPATMETIREQLAASIAGVYGNEVNEVYRQHADAILPQIQDFVNSHRPVVRDPEYLSELRRSRKALLEEFSDLAGKYPLMSNTCWAAIEKINGEINRVLVGGTKPLED